MNLLLASQKYIKAGLSVIATDNSKRSLFPWKKYQSEVITTEELTTQLSHNKAAGLAIICGAVSGGLEVIDVDCKYALTPDYFDKLCEAINAEAPELLDRCVIIRTKGNGYHIYYRCESIEGNQKLAMRPPTDQERKDNPQIKSITLIETRGEAGYVIAPPTDGYEKIQGSTIPVITLDEREALLNICRSFNEYFEQPSVNPETRTDKSFGISPFEDYNRRGDVIELLQRHGWTLVRDNGEKAIFKRPGTTDSKSSGDFNRKLGWFSVFTTNSVFMPNKAYLPYAVFTMLECNGDYKCAAKKLIEMGYGEKIPYIDTPTFKKIWALKSAGLNENKIKDAMRDLDIERSKIDEMYQAFKLRCGDDISTFWEVDRNLKISINRYKLMKFLEDFGGFSIYFYDKSSSVFKIVKVKDGFIEEASTQQIKEFIKKYIKSLPERFDGGTEPDDLLEVVLKGSGTYFTDQYFEFFNEKPIDFLKSTQHTNYFPFRNGIVVVDKKGISIKSYGELGKTVWKSRVIPFDIEIDKDLEPELCEYFRFIQCISGNEGERLIYCMQLIGYLLHSYKDASKPFAVILAEETENDKDGGGTGKGIFVKALSYLIRTVKLDGKNFKIDKSFALQRVSLDTQLISIEDCDKGLDFEKFNSQITEGSVVEKKNKDELFIDYKDSPKFIFSTNYMLNLKGNHGKRRSRVFEFSPFFSPTHTPLDHFKRLMFDDWDEDEWSRFYNFMFVCVQEYLDHGLQAPPQTTKLRRKQVRVNFGEEFLDYFDSIVEDHKGQWLQIGGEFQNFLNLNQWDKKDYSSRRFTKALESASEIMGFKYDKRRNRQNNNMHEFMVTDTSKIAV